MVSPAVEATGSLRRVYEPVGFDQVKDKAFANPTLIRQFGPQLRIAAGAAW